MLSMGIFLFTYFCNLDVQSFEKAKMKDEEVQFHAMQIPFSDLKNNRIKLQTQAALDLQDMITRAAREGYHIQINYGFRDHELQKQLWKRNKRLAAKPGRSKHELGLAVDINGLKRNKELRLWLRNNSHRYGWQQTIKKEIWHFEYVQPIYSFCSAPQDITYEDSNI